MKIDPSNRRNFLSGLIVLAALGLRSGQVARSWSQDKSAPEPPTDLGTLVQGNNQFAFDLYARLAKEPGNIVVSPYSISTALAMTYAGARGETATEMAKTLHYDLGQERLHPAFADLASKLQKDDGNRPYKLHIANSLWAQKGMPFAPGFLDFCTKHYRGGFKEVDFAFASEAARKEINAWVMEKTNDKIEDLLKPGVINSQTRLVLANALYFKGTWEMPFPKENTKNGDFEIAPDQKRPVPMMSINLGRFRYFKGDECQWLELPYKGKRWSMLLGLPHERGSLSTVEKSLTARDIQTALTKLRVHLGPVSLPRFKITKPYSLVEDLKAMGMRAAFAFNADFSGIAPGLRITAVEHKAFIDVDEVGTEAAAATAVIMELSAPPRFSFRADHPFLFLIFDRETGTILFQGRVTNPDS
jgi:serpin B